MCGISGFCNLKHNRKENIEKMNSRMFHRGPDAGGFWESEDGSVVLGHQRLSIIDLSANGAQPMVSHSGRFVMVYNGEIYNFYTLRKKLVDEKKVESFRGSSDTEVLLEAIEAYGLENTLALCKGMFGIAVYDKQDKVLKLARDRIGEKPLYYGFLDNLGAFAFCSDIGSMAQIEGFANPIFTDVLDIYFTHGYIPAPYSIYRGIYKLEAGTVLTIRAPFDENSVSTKAYWSVAEVAKKGQDNLFKGSRQEAADELERLLKASIKDQMVADVPVGAFLSAGIDSTTVVALMQAQAPGKVKSFTIGMEEKGYNEADVAKEIAAHLGTEHTEKYITKKEALDVIPKLSYMYGEPFADSSQIPTYLVSEMTRQKVTVSLSGDGGDELFCGYTSYEGVDRIWNKMKNVPYGVRKLASEAVLHSPLVKKEMYRVKGTLLGGKGPSDIYRIGYEYDPLTKQIAKKTGKISTRKDILEYKYTQYPPRFLDEVNHNIMLMDMQMYHPDDILVKVDRAAMAVSLETRVPMLDKDVVEFAWTLPIEYLRDGKTGKLVLRDVLYRYVPKDLMERPKKGFSIPIDKWLLEPGMTEWAESLLDRKLLEQQGILNPDVVRFIWEDFVNNGQWRIQIWYILMFQSWMADRF